MPSLTGPLYRLYAWRLAREIRRRPVPGHVAIILDGGRRYARQCRLADPGLAYGLGAEKLDEALAWTSCAREAGGRWAIEVTTGRVTPRELRGLGEFTRRFPAYRPLVICEPGEQGAAERLGIAAMSWQDFLWQGPVVKR